MVNTDGSTDCRSRVAESVYVIRNEHGEFMEAAVAATLLSKTLF